MIRPLIFKTTSQPLEWSTKMSKEESESNLLRTVAAQLHLLASLATARELFGKSYFALGMSEQLAADQAAWNMVADNYRFPMSEALAAKTQKEPIGFTPAAK
jgi:hypothetical protein